MKILLIFEDNLKMRELIKNLLKETFCQIYECEDGSEAFNAYKLYNPDWVLMDIVMRKMNGINATKQITDSFPDAKIIIVTDYDNEELREKARSAGAYDYVLK